MGHEQPEELGVTEQVRRSGVIPRPDPERRPGVVDHVAVESRGRARLDKSLHLPGQVAREHDVVGRKGDEVLSICLGEGPVEASVVADVNRVTVSGQSRVEA